MTMLTVGPGPEVWGGGVGAGPGRRHPLAGPWVADRAGGEEEAGAGVVPPAAQVVVGEVLAARVLEARLVARGNALDPTQALQQLVPVAGAVVEAGAEGQVVGEGRQEQADWGGQEG